MERVRLWREDHPGYWRKRKKKSAGTLQDVCLNQAPDPKPVAEADPQDLFRRTLQDLCLAKGQDLLDIPSGRSLNQTLVYDTQKTSPSRSAAADSAAL